MHELAAPLWGGLEVPRWPKVWIQEGSTLVLRYQLFVTGGALCSYIDDSFHPKKSALFGLLARTPIINRYTNYSYVVSSPR